MKEFLVNLEHTTRQRITVLADTDEEAALLVHGMYCTTNALSHVPIVTTTGKIICGDVKLVLPVVQSVPVVICDSDDADEIDCEHDFSDATDEVEAAMEHLEYALSKLYGENA